jgi:hypothetical protein
LEAPKTIVLERVQREMSRLGIAGVRQDGSEQYGDRAGMMVKKRQVRSVRVERIKEQLLELYEEMSDRERLRVDRGPDAASTRDGLALGIAPGHAGSRAWRTWRTMSERAAIYGHPPRGVSCADVLIEALELAAALRRASTSGA